MNDLYQEVTDRIIKSLEAGVPPWLPPWEGSELSLPENVTSGHRYRGINILLLHLTALERGYNTSRWLTFKQALDIGAHVRKGESGTPVVFFKPLEIAEKANTPDATTKVIPLLRYFTVFNIDQVEGLPETLTPVLPQHDWDPLVAAETLLINSRARIQHGGSKAYYRPSDDVIQLPPRSCFPTASDYYGTALHELTHWTGAPSRCNRPLDGRRHIDAYAFEELVAEMGAAFTCAHCHLPARLEHASD
ncbi:MAG: ArdC-like ssDNA-binding domain-containing protein, partial [Betaproteobacteria bacterium]